MSDQSQAKGLTPEERHKNKVQYTGKQIYSAIVTIRNEVYAARANGITDEELSLFGELDLDLLVDAAREMGNVPEWNSEAAPVGRKLTYPERSTGVAQ